MQNEWWTKKAQEIQSFADINDMHNFYNAVKSIYGPRSHCITPLQSADGLKVLKDQDSILGRWAEHFNTLLNQNSDADFTILKELPEFPSMDHLSQPPTFLEVLSAVRTLKNNKSPGSDNIPAELLKQGPRFGLMKTSHNNGERPALLPYLRTKVIRPSVVTIGAYHFLLWQARSWPR